MVITLLTIGAVLVGGLILIALFIGSIYNRLVALRNRFENAYAQIDVQLTRRYDLIPNLVETAKGYMKHEKETLEAVIQARNQAFSAGKAAAKDPGEPTAIKDLQQAEQNLGGALGRLMMVAESYPDLKANENMIALQEELTSTENKISYARQSFNDSVMKYNVAREQFPSNIIAGMFNFKPAELLELEEPEAKHAPKVSF